MSGAAAERVSKSDGGDVEGPRLHSMFYEPGAVKEGPAFHPLSATYSQTLTSTCHRGGVREREGGGREGDRARARASARARAREREDRPRVCLCVCVCVRERERERENLSIERWHTRRPEA
jgi:hypothetical protein